MGSFKVIKHILTCHPYSFEKKRRDKTRSILPAVAVDEARLRFWCGTHLQRPAQLLPCCGGKHVVELCVATSVAQDSTKAG